MTGPYENQDGTSCDVWEENRHIMCDDDGETRDLSQEARD